KAQGFVTRQTRKYLFDNSIPYRYYKFDVEPRNNYKLQIGEINLACVSSPDWQTIGPAPATKEMFDTHGMTDLSIITDEAIQQLTSDAPELLCWTDEERIVQYTENIIPKMISNTSPEGIA